MTDGDAAPSDAERSAELAARNSYGRLLAYLAARWRDVAAAEDALGDAFVAALCAWPRTGVPDQPDAWLLAAAEPRAIGLSEDAAVREFLLGEASRIGAAPAIS